VGELTRMGTPWIESRAEAVAAAADAVLKQVTTGPHPGRVPGVIAGLTTHEREIYLGAAGERDMDSGEPMTVDTVVAISSATKPITTTAALQLVESGQLDLDAPARDYAPGLAEVQVIDGFDDQGAPVMRSPKRDITTRHLLTHTAGFGYDFFNETYSRLASEHGQPSITAANRAALHTPLLFDPGEAWEYGSSIDWAGQVIEGVTGRRLGEVMQERIFDPLEMTETTFDVTGPLSRRLARLHVREPDGQLTPVDFRLPDPEIHMGGHGLVSTVSDYLKFIRMWLNGGAAPSGKQILRSDTIVEADRNHLGEHKVHRLPGIIPNVSNDAEFFPGQSKSWSLTAMINDEEAPTGRPAGSLAWAGLANLFYWIDHTNDVGGFWATQILPFFDVTSTNGYLEMETAVYHVLRS